jgi:hypothetical protein
LQKRAKEGESDKIKEEGRGERVCACEKKKK